MRQHVYRPCPCGETAHAFDGTTMCGSTLYKCRNCRRLITVSHKRSQLNKARELGQFLGEIFRRREEAYDAAEHRQRLVYDRSMSLLIKTTYGSTTRYFAQDTQGWHTTSADKAKSFDTQEEADRALAEIKKTFKGIEAVIFDPAKERTRK